MLKIVIKRLGAMGDVLLATPIARRFREECGPTATIDFITGNPQCLAGTGYKNPHINAINAVSGAGDYDTIIDLDGIYEKDRRRHQVDSFMDFAFNDTDGDKSIVFPIGSAPELSVDWSRVIAIHPAIAWPSRTMPQAWWQVVVDRLVGRGFQVISLGTHKDHFLNNVLDTRSRLSLHQQAATIAASRGFLCSDSGLFTLAGATETPIVVVCTVTKPEYFMPYRHGQLGWNVKAICPNISCFGCSADVPPGSTYVQCRRNDNICISMIEPDRVCYAVEDAIFGL